MYVCTTHHDDMFMPKRKLATSQKSLHALANFFISPFSFHSVHKLKIVIEPGSGSSEVQHAGCNVNKGSVGRAIVFRPLFFHHTTQ